MRLNRLPGAASNPEPAGGHRAGAGVVRVLSVTAVAVATCALSALPAMASSAAPAAPAALIGTTTTITYPALDAPVTEPAGTEVTLTATVTAADGSTPTGTVSFAPWNIPGPYEAYQVCTATLEDGTGSCQVDPPVGTWGFMQFEATYSGDATHAGRIRERATTS